MTLFSMGRRAVDKRISLHFSMDRILFYLLTFSIIISWNQKAWAQIVVLDSFNPPETSSICSIGIDLKRDNIWIYECLGDSLYSYSTSGNLISAVLRPGERANDVDIMFAPEQLMLGDTSVPEGTLLFINGESGTAVVYAIDKDSGVVIDTLNTSFGNSHVVGGAYHPMRNTIFLLQDSVAAVGNRIAEVNPMTGEILQTFGTPGSYSIYFGDLDVAGSTGNLFIVSSIEDSIAEVTAEGISVQSHALPAGVSLITGIALDCVEGEAWVVNLSGTVFHLGGVPCGSTPSVEEAEADLQGFALDANYPNPFNPQTSFRYVIPRTLSVRLAVYDVLGGLVRVLVNERKTTGTYLAVWNGTDTANEPVASGVYFYRFSAGEFTVTHRMVLTK